MWGYILPDSESHCVGFVCRCLILCQIALAVVFHTAVICVALDCVAIGFLCIGTHCGKFYMAVNCKSRGFAGQCANFVTVDGIILGDSLSLEQH